MLINHKEARSEFPVAKGDALGFMVVVVLLVVTVWVAAALLLSSPLDLDPAVLAR